MKRYLALGCVVLCSWLIGVAPAKGASWASGTYERSRSLTYTGTVPLLGRPQPITLSFYCNPQRTSTSTGAIGFEIEIGSGSLEPFDVDDFEGPDAPSHRRKLMRVSFLRRGKVVRSFRTSPAGFRPAHRLPSGEFTTGGFTFEVSAGFDERGSMARRILCALADKDADAFHLTITDYRHPRIKLEVDVPVTGKRADFQLLLRDLPGR